MKRLYNWFKFNRYFTVAIAKLLKKRLRLGYINDAPLYLELTTWLTLTKQEK